MPTTLTRTSITHTPPVERALTVAAVRWPGESSSRLLYHLIETGAETIAPSGPDPVTAALDELADALAQDSSPNAGKAIIDSGAWQW